MICFFSPAEALGGMYLVRDIVQTLNRYFEVGL